MSDEVFSPAIARPANIQPKRNTNYFPAQGDIVRFHEPPGIGERYGDEIIDKGRPWIVISSDNYNLQGHVRAVPITSKSSGSEWEIPIPNNSKLYDNSLVHGFVLIRPSTWHWQGRRGYLVGKCGSKFLIKIIDLDNKVTQMS